MAERSLTDICAQAGLSPRETEAFQHASAGRNPRETAARMGCSVACVASLLSKGRRRILAALDREERRQGVSEDLAELQRRQQGSPARAAFSEDAARLRRGGRAAVSPFC